MDTPMNAKTRQRTLRLLSNGVYVLTSRAKDRLGVATVTWVSQASFKPPLLMAAVRKSSNVFRCLVESRVAALHILGSDQRDVAQKFFSPTKGNDGSLNGEPFAIGKTSAPILQNIRAYVECKVLDIREEYGDHAVVVLEVVEAVCSEDFRPLTIADSPWEYGG
jgi:flavin reductase (DIM6/NTAB) family NADH-FMN oxidoreductase RutF